MKESPIKSLFGNPNVVSKPIVFKKDDAINTNQDNEESKNSDFSRAKKSSR